MTINTTKDEIYVLAEGFDGAKNTLCIGTHASLQTVYQSPNCPEILSKTLIGPLSWQQRNGITVEEALLSPNLAPQWLAALLAFGAKVTFPKGEGLPSDFPHGARVHAGKFSILKIPFGVPGRVWGEAHVGRTPADQPIATAIAVVDLEEGFVRRARLVLTGTWHEHAHLAHAVEQLINHKLSQGIIQEVAIAVEEEVSPPDDFRGSAEYRRAMAGTLSRRALEQCMEEASQL